MHAPQCLRPCVDDTSNPLAEFRFGLGVRVEWSLTDRVGKEYLNS
jgi:hypothetical protein